MRLPRPASPKPGDLLVSKYDAVPLVDDRRESVGTLSRGEVILTIEEPDDWAYIKALCPRSGVVWVFKNNLRVLEDEQN